MEYIGDNIKITVENGIITALEPNAGTKNGLYITPRFVELHCHLREPGYENKETVKTGIESAFAGGYGTICPMPNTNPVCDNPNTLKYILQKSLNPYDISVNPICAITSNLCGNNLSDFKTLDKLGAAGFSNDGKPIEDMGVFKSALLKAIENNVLIISHAENTQYKPDDPRSEWTAVEREIQAVRETGGRLHFAHISTRKSIDLIKTAKLEGLDITAETAPHYFTFSNQDIVNCQARFKMNPPLRTKDDVKAVKYALKDNTIDVIATDHAPHTNDEKLLPFDKSPFGITGFETAFALSYTNLVLPGILTIDELINKLVYAPLKILGKNRDIRVGVPAEFNIIDLNKNWIVHGKDFKTKCKITPYENIRLQGKVVKTVIKDRVYEI